MTENSVYQYFIVNETATNRRTEKESREREKGKKSFIPFNSCKQIIENIGKVDRDISLATLHEHKFATNTKPERRQHMGECVSECVGKG